jgi:hypothetical protein
MIKFDYQNTSWRIDMDKNVGGADKSIRVVLGVVLILAGIFFQVSTGLRIALLIVSGVALVTAFTGL